MIDVLFSLQLETKLCDTFAKKGSLSKCVCEHVYLEWSSSLKSKTECLLRLHVDMTKIYLQHPGSWAGQRSELHLFHT